MNATCESLNKKDILTNIAWIINSYSPGSLEHDIWTDAYNLIEDMTPTHAHWIVYSRPSSADSYWEKSQKCSNCLSDPSYSDTDNYCSNCGKPMSNIVFNENCEYFYNNMCSYFHDVCSCNGDTDKCEIGRRNRAAYRR